MLVVGLGGIGSEVAKRAHALGMRVIATRASGRTGPEYVSYVGLPDELPKLAAEADFVVNTAPLTPQTTGIFDAAFFAKMKPTALLHQRRARRQRRDRRRWSMRSNEQASPAPASTSPIPSRCRRTIRCGARRTSSSRRTSRTTPTSAIDAQVAVIQENLRRYVAGERMLSVVDVTRGY